MLWQKVQRPTEELLIISLRNVVELLNQSSKGKLIKQLHRANAAPHKLCTGGNANYVLVETRGQVCYAVQTDNG